jgi:Na+/H+ antiporter NhaD/arsenite permease-like protein
MSGWQFLKAGMIVMPVSLIFTLAAALLSGH